uniref:F-box associated domain-containing protein n=1 Tax=Setaria digitata TaxID=48799 RepID=A0A915Q1B5_9BILA
MTEALSLMYGIDLPTRSIVGLPAEQERTLFLVGTLSLKQDNQVCLLEVDDDWLQITKRSFNHPAGEIWYLSSSPVDSGIISTCYLACKYALFLESESTMIVLKSDKRLMSMSLLTI